MKKFLYIVICLKILVSQTHALSDTEITNRINEVQNPVSSNIPAAPSGNDQKGFIGEIIAGVFNTSGKVKTEFIQAFESIIGINDNIPKWTGGEFTQGTIWDKNGNIGIGNPNPQYQFDVDGDINFSGDLYKNGVLLVSTGITSTGAPTTSIGSWSSTDNSVFTSKRVGIGTSDPQSMLHVTGTGRFEGGVKVDEVPAISGNNVYHRAQPSQISNYPNYGYFEMRNKAGELGAYIGKGDGSDRVDLMLDRASILYMGKADGTVPKIGIGVLDPQAALHVDGDIISNANIISNNPTADNHLTTKSYVDTAISNIPVPGITLHKVLVETAGRTINAHNYCKSQGYTGYFAGMDNDGGSENILCFTTNGIDVNDIGTTTVGAGSNSGGSTLPTCSAGEILKHDGNEFICSSIQSGGFSGTCTDNIVVKDGLIVSCDSDTPDTSKEEKIGLNCNPLPNEHVSGTYYMLGRCPDTQGYNFWDSKYNSYVLNGQSKADAKDRITKEMIESFYSKECSGYPTNGSKNNECISQYWCSNGFAYQKNTDICKSK